MSIHAGNPLINRSGRAATLGPLLRAGRKLISVVARYSLDENGVMLDRLSKEVVGKAIGGKKFEDRHDSVQVIVDILAPISLEKSVATSHGGMLKLFTSLADPADHVRKPVHKLSGSGRSVGRITAIDAAFHVLDSRTNLVQKYHGAFEIASSSDDLPFATTGDAGAPVYTDENELLGILIGVAGDRSYAVPASRLKSHFSVEAASFQDLLEHNRQVTLADQPAPLVNNREIVALYGSDRLMKAEARLNSRILWKRLLNVRQEAPQDQNWIFSDYEESRHMAPMLGARTFLQNLHAHRLQFLETANPSLSDCRYNYIGGIESFLRPGHFDKNEIEQALRRTVDLYVRTDFPHLADAYTDELLGTEYTRVLRGKAISAPTAWLFFTTLRDIYSSMGEASFGRLWIEPAIFEAKESATALKNELEAHHKQRRAFEGFFGSVVRQMERFPSFSGTKVIETIAEGRAVRFFTAWAAERAVQLFKNNGYGLSWHRSMSPSGKHAAVDDAMSHAPLVVKADRQARRHGGRTF